MTAHPNAHILAQLAEIAKTNDKPWKRLETKDANGDWVDCNFYASLLCPEAVFRIKPATVKLGGVELEGPLREASEDGTKLWLLFDHTDMPDKFLLFFAEAHGHVKWLNQGRLFASKGARDNYQNALVKLAMGETTPRPHAEFAARKAAVIRLYQRAADQACIDAAKGGSNA